MCTCRVRCGACAVAGINARSLRLFAQNRKRVEEMEEIMNRAQVLIEAIPYIRAFHGKTFVIKYGGHAMCDHELKQTVMLDITLLKYLGLNPVLVHGGGPEITEMLEKTGKKSMSLHGQRVTDRETMEVVNMVLAGKINKELVALLNHFGVKAAGLSGQDGGLLRRLGRRTELPRQRRDARERRDRPEFPRGKDVYRRRVQEYRPRRPVRDRLRLRAGGLAARSGIQSVREARERPRRLSARHGDGAAPHLLPAKHERELDVLRGGRDVRHRGLRTRRRHESVRRQRARKIGLFRGRDTRMVLSRRGDGKKR